MYRNLHVWPRYFVLIYLSGKSFVNLHLIFIMRSHIGCILWLMKSERRAPDACRVRRNDAQQNNLTWNKFFKYTILVIKITVSPPKLCHKSRRASALHHDYGVQTPCWITGVFLKKASASRRMRQTSNYFQIKIRKRSQGLLFYP